MRDFHVIFDAGSRDAQSGILTLEAGWILELTAFGFPVEWVMVEGAGKMVPAACVLTVLMREAANPPKAEGCGSSYSVRASYEDVLAEGPYVRECCQVELSGQNPVEYLNFPGHYRLVLNTDSVLGDVQVYGRAFTKGRLGLTGD